MSDNDDLAYDELAALKARADLLGLPYHPSIGVDKLREKVNAVLLDKTDGAVSVAPAQETDSAVRIRQIEEATKLVRIRVTCMNPAKKEWEGEIFSVANAVVGTHKKYVPFNVEDGWHVPNIIYQFMIACECQIFHTVTDARGNKGRKGKLIKEYAIEVLDQLTSVELKELAQRQAMAKSID